MRRQIPLLRGLAILAVVCNHASGLGFVAMFWWVHRYRPVTPPNYDQLGTFPYYVLTAINQLALFSVPAFLFISGLFVTYAARGSSPVLSWRVVRARLLNLLWPYLIWSVVIFAGDGLLGIAYSPAEYVRKLMTGNADRAYFFVPLLAQFYLLSPFIVRWAKIRGNLLLVLSALVQLAAITAPYLVAVGVMSDAVKALAEAPAWLFVHSAFFFPLGVVIGFRLKQSGLWLARFKWGLLTTTLVLGVLSILEHEWAYRLTEDWAWAHNLHQISSNLYAVAFILAFLSLNARPSSLSRVVERVGGMSYGIYLLHPKVVEMTSKVIYHVVPRVLARQALLQPLLLISSVGLPWLLMRLVRRSPARRVYRYLFG